MTGVIRLTSVIKAERAKGASGTTRAEVPLPMLMLTRITVGMKRESR